MIQKLIAFFLLLAILLVVLYEDLGAKVNVQYEVYDYQEIHAKAVGGGNLTLGFNDLFMAAGECNGCHGFDPLGNASVDGEGNDINVVDDWRASIMGNSAKDPFWIAKVNHESQVFPAHQTEIESSCTDCHAPLGFFNAVHIGLDSYTMEDLAADSIAKDGVSCNACHQMLPDSVGRHFSGEIYYQEDIIYGPYEDPFGGPMSSFVGFIPEYDEYITKSEACASCHTLITETIDTDGNITDFHYVEQATYHEWLNSSYNIEGKNAMQCQNCHMTQVNDDVIISANLLFLPPRNPFYRHEFMGANSFMLQMMKDNADTLDIGASAERMDLAIDNTLEMLQERTLDLYLTEIERDDSTTVQVELVNKAGHKFPSGYPSRLAFIEFLAVNLETGEDTIFASGLLDEDHRIIERDVEYEPHFDFINSESQVQIYENVLEIGRAHV